ncbi:MAG: hypothetical protein E7547_08195 [Ruminococcaceae bacterium]|nr:hypothetical protein [Oscillospiraceae bacterium]
MGKKIICIFSFIAFIVALGLACFLREPVQVLESERRKAAQFPEFSVESVVNKTFFDGLEEYLADQFPLRDTFRSVKAAIQYKLLMQQDNNGVYTADGHISELYSELNEKSVSNAAKKINSIYDKYLANANTKCYFSVIPDKNYFLAEKNGYPTYDYKKMLDIYVSSIRNMEYIDIFGCLDVNDYYRTDSHWKQENIGDVVEMLGSKMRFTAKPADYYNAEKFCDFEGVYASRYALSEIKDEIICMTSEATQNATVFDFETNKTTVGVYDKTKLSSGDKYDIYLSGAKALLAVENPNAIQKRELVIFRDSFGSSLTPLLIENYSKITLVDLRYISSQVIGEYIDFNDCDVLFIYNTQILNQSSLLK